MPGMSNEACVSPTHVCVHCGLSFPSKNKLFAHLRDGSSCTAKAGLKVAEACEKVALVIGRSSADESWRSKLWKAIDTARDVEGAHGRVRYAESGGPNGAAFASDASRESQMLGLEVGTLQLCDVLSLTTEVLCSDEERSAWCAKANASLPPDLRILGRSQGLPSDFNADLSCIRRYYVCLVPLSLFVPGAAMPSEHARNDLAGGGDGNCGSHTCGTCGRDARHVRMGLEWKTFKEGFDGLTMFHRLKELLHRFEGDHSFHNFSSSLKLVPNDSIACRSLFHFKATTEIAEGVVDLEVATDLLLPGQLRAMVGLAIACHRGLLPEKYLDAALGDESLLSVPMVPHGTTCFAECTYLKNVHYMLQPMLDGPVAHAWRYRVRQSIIERLSRGAFEEWYRDVLVPSIPAMLAAHAACCALPPSPPVNQSAPEVYHAVLQLLREADSSGRWPGISLRREKVIKDSTLSEHGGGGGSFTVGSMPPPLQKPTANSNFPELMLRAFELERALMPGRPPSSTIAINKHAQFLPHVDSGAGAGQGISMIVGLGDYSGGQLVVEGTAHDIRYKPMEFNGWTQRHWTLPFKGERFSLVWFTPLGCEDMPGLSGQASVGLSVAESAEKSSGYNDRPSQVTPGMVSGRDVSEHMTGVPCVCLANGLKLPQLSFGTFQIGSAKTCEDKIMAALEAGFRSFDTAFLYRNEEELGKALLRWQDSCHWMQSGSSARSRESSHVFVTSKCPPSEMTFEKAQQACKISLERLGRDALDLYLVHWPALPKKPHASEEHRIARHQTWRALEQLYREGFVRAIGVSNFTDVHLTQLLEDGIEVLPMVNQIEVHPFCVPTKTIEFCASRCIVVQAYAPLGGGPQSNAARASGTNGTQLLLSHPTVCDIAKQCCCSAAQVLLCWSLQRGFAVVSRSSNSERMAQNLQSFDIALDAAQMERLTELQCVEGTQKFCWDPSTVQ